MPKTKKSNEKLDAYLETQLQEKETFFKTLHETYAKTDNTISKLVVKKNDLALSIKYCEGEIEQLKIIKENYGSNNCVC